MHTCTVLYEMPPAKPGSIYCLASFAEFRGKFTEKVTSRIVFQKTPAPKVSLLPVQSLFENILVLSCL